MLKRIYTPEELKELEREKQKQEKERAEKALELNGYFKPPYDPNNDPEVKRAQAALYDKDGFRRVTLKVRKLPLNPSPLFRRLLNEKTRKALELNGGF